MRVPHEPIDDRLLELLEACRPGSDDLSDDRMAPLAAELARNRKLQVLFARLQKFDAVVAGAVQDVPVPQGLGNRVLAALAAARVVDQALRSEDRPAESISPRPTACASEAMAACAAPTGAAGNRRAWAIGAAAAVAAVALASYAIFRPSMPRYTPSSALETAVAFFRGDNNVGGGELLADAAAPWGFAPSVHVRLPAGASWRRIADFLGTAGVAYDLPMPGKSRAALYAVRHTIDDLPVEPPAQPAHATGDCWAGAWQEGAIVYVLVVAGERGDYLRLIDVPLGPLVDATPNKASARSG